MTAPTPAQVEALITDLRMLDTHLQSRGFNSSADYVREAASALAALRDENAAIRKSATEAVEAYESRFESIGNKMMMGPIDDEMRALSFAIGKD